MEIFNFDDDAEENDLVLYDYDTCNNYFLPLDYFDLVNRADKYSVPEYDLRAFLPFSKCPWKYIDAALCHREINGKKYWFCLHLGKKGVEIQYKYIWLTDKAFEDVIENQTVRNNMIFLYDKFVDSYHKLNNIFFIVSIKGYKNFHISLEELRDYFRKFDNIFSPKYARSPNMDARGKKSSRKIQASCRVSNTVC